MKIPCLKTSIRIVSLLTALLVFTPCLSASTVSPPKTVIKHTPPKYFKTDYRIQLDTVIKDPQGVVLSRCYFRYGTQADYLFVPMQADGNLAYRAVLPAPSEGIQKIEYLFLTVNQEQRVIKSTPHLIKLSDTPKITAWLIAKDAGDPLILYTELSEPPKGIIEFNDNLGFDVAASSARFGSVAGLYAGVHTSASAGGGVAASSAAGAASTSTAVAGGTVATTAAVSATTVVVATTVTAAAIGGAAAAGGGGDSNGGGSASTPATADDFVGTWRGLINSDAGDPPQLRTMVIVNSGGFLTGTISNNGTADTFTGPASNGVWNITNTTTTSTNPDCTDFGSTGTATLNAAKDAFDLTLYGLFCRPTPNTMSGTLSRQ